jgi:simple sugar transport system ATP-binding protein
MQLLATHDISKRFGDFWANKHISLHIDSGEIVSLLGENGAGKTTLMNILYGLYRPTEGSVFIKGKAHGIVSPKDAIDMGISMVHQHFMLVDSLTVVENVIIGKEPRKGWRIDVRTANERVDELSSLYGLNIRGDVEVGKLSMGEKQRVELLKALYNDCDILILDEPTAVLTPGEVDNFFAILKKLKNAGKGIILISHKLKETLAIADRIYIMRSGEIITETRAQGATVDSLAEQMVGRPLDSRIGRHETSAGTSIFSLRHVDAYEGVRKVLDGISFDVKSGTILGIAGVDGNGQTELVELAVGMRTASDGVVTYLGKDITRTDVRYRLRHGIGYVPEDRQSKGLVGAFTLKENLVLGYERDKRFSHRGIVDWKEVDGYAEDVISDYDVRCQGKEEQASALSGGNQQKLIIGRVLESNPTMIVAAQPTRGVDIGAVEYIHRKLIDMRNKGKAILLVSADLDEIMELSDEIAVVYEGKIVSMAQNGAYTKTELGSFMTGARSGGEK